MVYLIGAGPGDPGLITVKAIDLLKRADIVLYDRLIDSTLLSYTKHGCDLIDVGKSAGEHTKTQDETTNLLVEMGRKDLEVVRLKGGDPFLFGRGSEEAERLKTEGIPYEIIPGVSALTAVPAYAGIPLTHRDFASSVCIATGHGAQDKEEDPVRWGALAQSADTIVVFMGMSSIETITGEIAKGGLPGETPAAVIEKGSTPNQRVITGTLASIPKDVAREQITPPALLIIGKTVKLHDTLNWYEAGPLAGLRVGITRPAGQAKTFSDNLSALGAQPVLMPSVQTVEAIETDEVKKSIERVSEFDCIVFSSTNGVKSFFRALKRQGKDTRALAGIRIASIGSATSSSLEEHGITPGIAAEKYIAEGLVDALFADGSVEGLRFLLVSSDIGRKTLSEELCRAGASVTKTVFYSTQPANLSQHIKTVVKNGKIDVITFTSSSTAINFFKQIQPGEFDSRIKIASIGPQTSETLKRFNREPDIEALVFTTDGLVSAILEYCGKKR